MISPRNDKWRQTILCLLVGIFVFPSSNAYADGGTLRFSGQCGAWRVSAFTSPTPVRVGMVDVSVLVQESTTGKPRPDLAVKVRAQPLESQDERQCEPATVEAATNKLFRATQLSFTKPGIWEMEVEIEDSGERATAQFQLPVEEPLLFRSTLGLWIGWPGVAVLLFGIHEWLVHRRQRLSKSD